MTPIDFCYWLSGIFQCTDKLSKDQAQIVSKRLEYVLTKMNGREPVEDTDWAEPVLQEIKM